MKTIEEVSGQDLRWFFDQAVNGTAILDYELFKIDSYDTAWPNDKESGTTHSYVTVHRKGDFVFPVTVEVRFDDGTTVRETWDSKDRWKRFDYVKTAKVLSATIDPDHKVMLDRDFLNNSKTVEARPRATWKLTNLWMFVLGLVEHFAGGLV